MKYVKIISLSSAILSSIVIQIWAGVGLKIQPEGWDIGKGSSGTWTSQQITVTNIGDEPGKVLIQGQDTNWTFGTTPGPNQFAMQFSKDGSNWTTITKSSVTLAKYLDIGESYSSYLRFQSPTSITPVTLAVKQNIPLKINIELTPKIAKSYTLKLTWGSSGYADGQFQEPSGIAVDYNNNRIYVADAFNSRIQVFNLAGEFITKWTTSGPQEVALDNDGNILVTGGGYIQKFNSNGGFITRWSLDNANGIAVDSNGYIYVTAHKYYNNEYITKVYKYNTNGGLINSWGSTGNGDGQFNSSTGKIAVDSNNNVYVNDGLNGRIQKFTSNGVFISKWCSPGGADGQINYGTAIAVDNLGCMYIGDRNTSRIQKIDSTGKFITKFYSKGSWVNGLDIDNAGNIYAASRYGFCIEIYTPQ